jgi:hypothetical protein
MLACLSKKRGVAEAARFVDGHSENPPRTNVPFESKLAIRMRRNLRLGKRTRQESKERQCLRDRRARYGLRVVTIPAGPRCLLEGFMQ